jgi:hypothetical protein
MVDFVIIDTGSIPVDHRHRLLAWARNEMNIRGEDGDGSSDAAVKARAEHFLSNLVRKQVFKFERRAALDAVSDPTKIAE